MQKKYKVITLCGSTRFKEQFLETQKQLTLAGNIVISVGIFGHSDYGSDLSPDIKEMLDDMHKRKIDMADEIFVINVNGYIGDSTALEMQYATQTGKIIRFLEPEGAYIDKVGGYHTKTDNWNKNGVYCEKCNKKTCEKCARTVFRP